MIFFIVAWWVFPAIVVGLGALLLLGRALELALIALGWSLGRLRDYCGWPPPEERA